MVEPTTRTLNDFTLIPALPSRATNGNNTPFKNNHNNSLFSLITEQLNFTNSLKSRLASDDFFVK